MPHSAESASSSSWGPLRATRMPRRLLRRSRYGGVGSLGGSPPYHPYLTLACPPLTPVPTAGPAASGHTSPQRAEGDEEGCGRATERSLLQAQPPASLTLGGGACGACGCRRDLSPVAFPLSGALCVGL